MEVKPGYKQTEVGVIPEDWDVEPLGTRASFKTGPFGSTLHQSDYIDGGIPVINPMHINDGRITPIVTMSVSEEAGRRLTDFRMKPGEIIIGRRGDMGRCAVVDEGHAGWMCGTGSMLIRPRLDHPSFLQRILSSTVAIKAIEDASVGSTMINLNQATLSGLNIQIPPIEEQDAIATALSDMDALLDGLDRLIVKKRAIKQATMQQLLTGQTRLPGFWGEWEVKRLGDLGIFMKGSGVRKDEAQSGVLPCIRYGELYTHHHDVIRSFNSYISKEVAQSATRIRAGDILFACSGETKEEIGKCAVFIDDEEAYAGGDIVILRLSEADPMFMGYYCNTPNLVSQKASFGQGDAVVHISAKALAEIEVYIPEEEEQAAIATILSDMDTEITSLETRRTKTRALKQAMMQELLTGRTRLSRFNKENSRHV
ncbi:restriction endonuclease subunit S [Denitratimonas sp. CY0512]|uniref:restriction endonuclease subunit S n=1 Tax=Denitratimonas sp. CY0512 TaxID=3131940 RepID=UPI0030ABA853